MANRTGVYVVFHAGGTTDPTASDRRYYGTLQMWDANKHHEFTFTNSHDKTNAVRDSSKKETLERALKARLNASKSVLLIATASTPQDTDWVPFEIDYAVESCGLPIIVAYPERLPSDLPVRAFWPAALAKHVAANRVRTLHIPFLQKPIMQAIAQFSVQDLPYYAVTTYTEDTYRRWGVIA